jgi:hypothetical protein
MRDPTTNLALKEFIELAIQRLSDRQLANTLAVIEELRHDLLVVKERTEVAIQRLNDRRLANALAVIEELRHDLLDLVIARETKNGRSRQGARKRGRPSAAVLCDMQIASAVAMLVEEAGLNPTRSHCGLCPRNPSACSIVTIALKQLGGHLGERTVEGIWNRYRRSSAINHELSGTTKGVRSYK